MKFFGRVTGYGDGLPTIGNNFGFCIAADEVHVDDITSVALKKTRKLQFLGYVVQRCGGSDHIPIRSIDQNMFVLGFNMPNAD